MTAGTISTVAGNGTAGFLGDTAAATSAELDRASGVAVDSSGNLYIADTDNYVIRKVSGGTITTYAGSDMTTMSAAVGAGTMAWPSTRSSTTPPASPWMPRATSTLRTPGTTASA